MRFRSKLLIALCTAACAACAVFILFGNKDNSLNTDAKAENPDVVKLTDLLASDSFNFNIQHIAENKEEFLSDLFSVLEDDKENLLRLVDKKHLLEEIYEPDDLVPLTAGKPYAVSRNSHRLRSSTEQVLARMAEEARKDGITVLVGSAYRSYSYQKTIYERNVRTMGKENADRESAFPGASQHQLGTAVDFGSIDDSFAETAAGKWIAANAGRFGFSLSFPQGYEPVTGYRWESWHYRYIGEKAVLFQDKWFSGIQQYMLEFIYSWN